MSDYLNIYKGAVTAGAANGTLVSTDDTFTAPIEFSLDAAINETKTMTCAIRAESGYKATNVTIQDVNDTNDRFKLCKTSNGTFTDTITFDAVNSTNSIFYVKASATSTDPQQSNRKVKLRYAGQMRVVST